MYLRSRNDRRVMGCMCLTFILPIVTVATCYFLPIALVNGAFAIELVRIIIITVFSISLCLILGAIVTLISAPAEKKRHTQTEHSIGEIIQEYITENRDEIISYYLLNAPARKDVAIQMENIYDVPRRIIRTMSLPNLAIELPIPELSPELLTTYDTVRATIENTNSTLVTKGKHKRSDSVSVSSMDSGVAKTVYSTEPAASDLESEQDPLEQIDPSTSKPKSVTWAADIHSKNDSTNTILTDVLVHDSFELKASSSLDIDSSKSVEL